MALSRIWAAPVNKWVYLGIWMSDNEININHICNEMLKRSWIFQTSFVIKTHTKHRNEKKIPTWSGNSLIFIKFYSKQSKRNIFLEKINLNQFPELQWVKLSALWWKVHSNIILLQCKSYFHSSIAGVLHIIFLCRASFYGSSIV